jgi:hypothetical protein
VRLVAELRLVIRARLVLRSETKRTLAIELLRKPLVTLVRFFELGLESVRCARPPAADRLDVEIT